MTRNKIKEPVIEEVVPEVKAPVKKASFKSTRTFIRFANIFGVVSRNQVVNAMPFILFITVLLMVYISNGYYAEGLIREIDQTKKELKEKRAEYITTMSRLMYVSNQSEVAKMLSGFGVKESTEPPYRIIKTKDKKK
jgi:hypothetical protein